jgi:hypothetical protein
MRACAILIHFFNVFVQFLQVLDNLLNLALASIDLLHSTFLYLGLLIKYLLKTFTELTDVLGNRLLDYFKFYFSFESKS